MKGRSLIVHIVFRLDYGGLENGVVNIVNALAGRPYQHAIIALTDVTAFSERLIDAVPVFKLGKRPGKDLGAYWRLFRLLRKLRPAVVHTRNIGTLDCVIVAFFAGVPVRVHGEHGWDISDPDGTSKKHRFMRRTISHLVTRFIAVSSDLSRWLTSEVGIPKAQVTCICNGVDTDRFRPGKSREFALRSPDGVRNGTLVVGSVTRFAPIKDPMNLVEAFIRLSERGKEAGGLRLIMVGDGELHEKALSRLKDAHMDDRCWLPGSMDDVPEILSGFDVFVLGSLREGISNTILEAMACGLPVIATSTGGNCELVISGESGILVPPGDPGALADAIEYYMRNPGIRDLHGRRARELAVSLFSIASMVDHYDRFYRSVSISPGA